MVVVSHLFFFFIKKLGRGAAHLSRSSPCLELSISRQPLLFMTIESSRSVLSIVYSSKSFGSILSIVYICILKK